jgi:hypothetical protein
MRGAPSKRRAWCIGRTARQPLRFSLHISAKEKRRVNGGRVGERFTLVHSHSLNRTHVIVQNSLLATIIPLDSNTSPIPFGNGATVGLIALPANTVTNGQLS